jgi:hypothetical protein
MMSETKWEPTGYQSERCVDGYGRIVGDVEYRAGRNEVTAVLRVPSYLPLGSYVSVVAAKAAVERAYSPSV